jgi:hypothetical protein
MAMDLRTCGSTEFRIEKEEGLPDISLYFFLDASAFSWIFRDPPINLALLRTYFSGIFSPLTGL